MQVIENLKVKEKLYKEKLDNGLTVMIIPKNKRLIILLCVLLFISSFLLTS